MNKRSIIIIVSILVAGLVIAGLYGTFASSNTVSINDSSYAIKLTDSTETISVPAGGNKTIIYQITNTNEGTVQYGIAYSGTGITAKTYENSADAETGLITYGENKFVKLYIENSASSQSTATIKTILGYENGGELDSIVPSGYTLVTEVYQG